MYVYSYCTTNVLHVYTHTPCLIYQTQYIYIIWNFTDADKYTIATHNVAILGNFLMCQVSHTLYAKLLIYY